jgi:hypothetical protein
MGMDWCSSSLARGGISASVTRRRLIAVAKRLQTDAESQDDKKHRIMLIKETTVGYRSRLALQAPTMEAERWEGEGARNLSDTPPLVDLEELDLAEGGATMSR